MQFHDDMGPLAAQANQTDRRAQQSYPNHESTSAEDDVVKIPFGTGNFPAFTRLAREMRFSSRQEKKRVCPYRGRDIPHGSLIVLDFRNSSEIVANSERHQRNASNKQIIFIQNTHEYHEQLRRRVTISDSS